MAETTRTIILSGAFTILGALIGGAITGWSNIQLAKQKFNSDLVLKALESNSADDRLQALKLLVNTNLISDSQIRQGVLTYTKEKEKDPSSIPQVTAAVPSLAPPIIENSRIFMLAGTSTKEALFSDYISELAKVGFKVIGAKRLQDPGRPDFPEVRYFNAQDKIQAEKIAEFMKFKLSDNRTQAKYYEDASAKPGYIEIWLGR